ncbi:Hsp20/alpha crystallin family protein [Hymenobacter latericus]|uniref:Hsp20/alpha crystallin family protein n=1 Tax=Hymenobacter sp. YIM 151858-1 TaxID=2987688 RepID=UPI0022278650|nr:Hsp20/alpha crystallin family protein [Hymenobacter sp. YIM 151858-1]UYZ58273.1 Hsp20/alpha crystallin family protein [Hymenobacter sp. YIM 151858-1]
MAIQRYSDSFGDMMPQSFSSMLDRFFNDSLNTRGRMNSFMPHVDAYETEQGYEIEASLPGLKREDIKVEFQQGRLSISGERRMQNERNDRRYHMMESQYGSFQRTFQLPDVANGQGIEATFEDGVLHITVPKDQQKTMRHQVEIRGRQPQQNNLQTGQVSDRMGQQATDIPVEAGNGHQHAGHGLQQEQPARSYQGATASAGTGASGGSAQQPTMGGQSNAGGPASWTNTSAASDSYGDGHPDDGAGSMRGSGVGS